MDGRGHGTSRCGPLRRVLGVIGGMSWGGDLAVPFPRWALAGGLRARLCAPLWPTRPVALLAALLVALLRREQDRVVV
jgi:hypothetical protein